MWHCYIEALVALFILATCGFPLECSALEIRTPHDVSSSAWIPLPHVDRRQAMISTAGLLSSTTTSITNDGIGAILAASSSNNERSVASVDSHPVIPVWPSWGGGRVVPASLERGDPFLLLAHHKHWFDPRDPLRKPFQLAGKALGLPYVDVEGFAMHPHRGFDIFTYVLDGSDGFRYRDSLNDNPRTYRGGTAQWMRTGSGVLHEEYWETGPDRRTNIELFQLWVNLPSHQKMDEPVIQYIGRDTEQPWMETEPVEGVRVRHVSDTLDASLFPNEKHDSDKDGDTNDKAQTSVQKRPPVNILHVTLQPGATWTAAAPPEHSAMIYVREGTATLPDSSQVSVVKALQTATFASNGSEVTIHNADRRKELDMLLLTGAPLREPVAMGGPIVMNTEQEINDAYRQLQNGTFLNRKVALRDHHETLRRSGRLV